MGEKVQSKRSRKDEYSRKFFEDHREEIQLYKAAKDAFNQLETKKLPTCKQQENQENKEMFLDLFHCKQQMKAV